MDTTKTTARRLAITPGDWQVDGSYPFTHIASVHGDGYAIRVGVQGDPDSAEDEPERDDEEAEANAMSGMRR